MPFKSKAQIRACFARKDPRWDCEKWLDETPNRGKDLPQTASKPTYIRTKNKPKTKQSDRILRSHSTRKK